MYDKENLIEELEEFVSNIDEFETELATIKQQAIDMIDSLVSADHEIEELDLED